MPPLPGSHADNDSIAHAVLDGLSDMETRCEAIEDCKKNGSWLGRTVRPVDIWVLEHQRICRTIQLETAIASC